MSPSVIRSLGGGCDRLGHGVAATTSKDIEGLYQLPPGEFTAARNALAAQLKKAGRAEEAEQVKALQKPSISAWAVNQLFWKHRKAFDTLLAAGERFRTAQAAQLAGKAADLRGPLDERRETLSELTKIAAGVLRNAGNNATPDILRRITTTLEALATYGNHPDAPQAGRLVDDIDPPGFEALAALVPQVGRGKRGAHEPTRVIPIQQKTREPRRRKGSPEEEAKRRDEEHKAEMAAARAAVADAERALKDARRTAEQAEATLKKAAARAKEAEREKEAIERQYEKLNAAFEAARSEARKVATEAEDAAQAVEDAERTLEKARRALDDL